MFSVALALLPVLFNALYAVTVDELPLTLGFLFGRGELLLLAVGLAAGALGELTMMKAGWGAFKLIATGFCSAVLAAASFYFAIVSGKYAVEPEAETGAVVVISLALYLGAVLSGGLCVLVGEPKGERDV